jgi:hypothetical protein
VGENTAVNALNAEDGGGWIKGHLLNDNLGGEGTSANLTPMTRAANAQYEHLVERPLKTALDKARYHAEYVSRGRPDFYFGVEFSARPFGQKFPAGSRAQRIGDAIRAAGPGTS